ncbi:MAG: hypothetical protein U1A25_00555 [Candidatus Sungbacteria bacterium]|nr:hypothetical protein [bacterium]MDZ4260135.1 hypothetical protein [Candidatus Sungbacteria bacterium]
MSKHQLTSTIQKELVILNECIDRKIIKGKSYSREARKHKMLLNQLHMLDYRQARSNLFRMFSFG